MRKPLDLDINLIQSALKDTDFSILAQYLSRTFKLERDQNGAPVMFENSVDAVAALSNILQAILAEKINENHKDILQELFRSLRNYVVNPGVQNSISANSTFLDNVKLTIDKCSDSIPSVVQIILQFLINLIVANKAAACTVWRTFSNQLHNLIKAKLFVHETSALIYNISLFQHLDLDFEMCVEIFELYESTESEYLHFLLERILTYELFWVHYSNINSKHKLLALSLLRQQQIKGEELNLPLVGVQTLITSFINSGRVIFQTISSNDSSLEICEVSELLQFVSSLCSGEKYLEHFRNNKDLLINTGVLLINMHNLGKDATNCFAPISNLAEIRQPTEVSKHPAFGFKADLIRIIGNLCWKNKTMQDLTREAELIPVILDCCNMDARNPFIMQWAILAVRNLCENNLENQKMIAGLHQRGTVSSSVLEEMGLTLHSEGGNSVKVVPLDGLRNSK